MRRPIADDIRLGFLPQGYEIQESDIGRLLCFHGWGEVVRADIGKRTYMHHNNFYIENSQQRDKRILNDA